MYTHPYTTVLHAQPRTQQAQRFAKTRLVPAINESDFLSDWHDKRGSELLMQRFARVSQKTGKEIQNFYAMTGTFAGGSADSGDSVRGLSTDMVCLDECFVQGTKILTNVGYKNIEEINECDLVAQFNPNTKEITFVKPMRFVKRKCEEGVIRKIEISKDKFIRVTNNHRIITTEGISYAKDFKSGRNTKYFISGKAVGLRKLTPLDKVEIMVQADGCLIYENTNLWRLAFRKPRKIERCEKLLIDADIDYRKYKNSRGDTSFLFNSDGFSKDFYKYFDVTSLSEEFCEEFLEELVLWDGSLDRVGAKSYWSCDKKNVEFVSTVATLCGYSANIHEKKKQNEKHSRHFYCSMSKNKKYTVSSYLKRNIEEKYDDYVYCLRVPTECLIVLAEDSFPVVVMNCQDMNLEELPTILEGMSHSPYKNQLYLGTPKWTGDTLMQTWFSSDKKEWHVTCPHCGKEFYLTFERIIDIGEDETTNYIYACPECRSEITDDDRMNGKWIATGDPNAEFSGYHITQLIVPWISANEIMEKKNSSSYSTKRFMTEVLGLPWVGDDQPITKDMLEACVDENEVFRSIKDEDRLFVGVDWNASHGAFVTILNQNHKLKDFVVIKNKETDKIPLDVAKYLVKYSDRIQKIAVDAGPSLGDYYSLKKNCKELGIFAPIYHCYYMSPPQITEQRVDEVNGCIRIGRSEIIQKVIEEFQTCRLTFPKMPDDVKEKIFTQYCNIASEMNTSIAGQEFLQYISIGQDHAFHSLIYAVIATGGLDYIPHSAGLGKKIENPRTQSLSVNDYKQKKEQGAFLQSVPSNNSLSRNYNSSTKIVKDRYRRKITRRR